MYPHGIVFDHILIPSRSRGISIDHFVFESAEDCLIVPVLYCMSLWQGIHHGGGQVLYFKQSLVFLFCMRKVPKDKNAAKQDTEQRRIDYRSNWQMVQNKAGGKYRTE